MKEPMFSLAPERVQYDEFWEQITKRNYWLILLRYGAVAMLLTVISVMFFLKLNFDIKNYSELTPLVMISIVILLYNLLFHKYHLLSRRKRVENFKIFGLRFSLLQICFDFIALMLFIYFTGGVDTPIYSLFIFHVIIGSLLLPGRIVVMIISITLAITSSGAYMEYAGMIPHYHISGWISFKLYQEPLYILVFFLTFATILYISIYLANSISRELYGRERELTHALKELGEAEKTKSRYVMTVVHDLKTPIAASTTYLNMLLDGALGEIKPEQLRPLERSKYRLDQAIESINDILQISQIKLKNKVDDVTDIDIKAVFEEIFEGMKVLFESKNQEYNFTLEASGKVKVQFDEHLLKLALSNIISNSQKYTPADGRIDVNISKDGNYVKVIIADSGIGIPKEQQDKIFQEFYRTPKSKKSGIEGTGLGMSLVKQIFDNFDCKISVKSPSFLAKNDEFPGTEFEILIPIIYKAT